MFDYLSSKLVWIIAALILTASVIGVFNWQRKSMEELEMEEQAESISELINELNAAESQFDREIVFDNNASGDYKFKSSINGQNYLLNFTSKGLFFVQNEKKFWNSFVKDVFLFNPFFYNEDTSKAELEEINEDVDFVKINSNSRLNLQSKKIGSDYLLFLYHEDEKIKEQTSSFGKKIEKALAWNLSSPEHSTSIELNNDIVFHQNYFFFETNNKCVIPYPVDNLNLYRPSFDYISRDSLEEKIDKNEILYVMSGEEIKIVTKIITIGENKFVLSFIYHSSR